MSLSVWRSFIFGWIIFFFPSSSMERVWRQAFEGLQMGLACRTELHVCNLNIYRRECSTFNHDEVMHDNQRNYFMLRPNVDALRSKKAHSDRVAETGQVLRKEAQTRDQKWHKVLLQSSTYTWVEISNGMARIPLGPTFEFELNLR